MSSPPPSSSGDSRNNSFDTAHHAFVELLARARLESLSAEDVQYLNKLHQLASKDIALPSGFSPLTSIYRSTPE
jgi:hypothetical protein